jgi:cytoskeletal protein CcmA (bactofilin family)
LNNTLTVVGASELKGNVGINSNLDVTGSVQIDTDLNVTGDSNLNDTYVSNLTQGNVTLAGANGQLVDNADLTFNGSELSIGGGNATININGDIATVGTLAVAGLENTGDLSVGGVLTVSGNTELQGDLYVSGNLQVLGSQTTVTIQSTTVELDDNIIRLNAYSPFERYAGFEVIDSGSSNTSASLLWDSANDYWLFMSSSGQSSKLIGTTAGTYGSETSLTSGTFPIASAGNTIGDSLLTYSGTTLALNTNKFTVDSSSGDTLVSGNFTLSATGGADNNTKTSAIMFRNSDNVIGFVSTTETEDVLDGILGYKHSNGGLTFSTVIDGGTY